MYSIWIYITIKQDCTPTWDKYIQMPAYVYIGYKRATVNEHIWSHLWTPFDYILAYKQIIIILKNKKGQKPSSTHYITTMITYTKYCIETWYKIINAHSTHSIPAS